MLLYDILELLKTSKKHLDFAILHYICVKKGVFVKSVDRWITDPYLIAIYHPNRWLRNQVVLKNTSKGGRNETYLFSFCFYQHSPPADRNQSCRGDVLVIPTMSSWTIWKVKVVPIHFIVAFNTDHAKTISNAKRSWNKKYIFSFLFVAVVCPFGTFGNHISV